MVDWRVEMAALREGSSDAGGEVVVGSWPRRRASSGVRVEKARVQGEEVGRLVGWPILRGVSLMGGKEKERRTEVEVEGSLDWRRVAALFPHIGEVHLLIFRLPLDQQPHLPHPSFPFPLTKKPKIYSPVPEDFAVIAVLMSVVSARPDQLSPPTRSGLTLPPANRNGRTS